LTPLDIVRSIQRSAKRSPVREEAKGALGTSKKQATTATRQVFPAPFYDPVKSVSKKKARGSRSTVLIDKANVSI